MQQPEYSETDGTADRPSGAAVNPAKRFVESHVHWWLSLMLLALHISLAWGIDSWWSRAFLLAHLGLFLLWQPVWRGENEVETRDAFLVVTVGLMLAGWNNWWFMAVWLSVLFALIGGSVPGTDNPKQRLTAILAALYLLSMLLVWVVPHLFKGQLFESAYLVLVRYGLLLIPVGIVLIPLKVRRSDVTFAVDLFYSFMLFLLVAALVLGSFVVKEVSHGNYVIALAQTLFVIALLLVVISWLWNPHSGFTGIGHVLSRYLMSLGLPFERWVQRLAGIADEEPEPLRFLSKALEHMLAIEWVVGVEWSSPLGQGDFGSKGEHSVEVSFGDLTLRIYTRWAPSAAVQLHLNLLTQMVGHFYEAKQREQLQRQHAYTQAIYETGARLTHDVKNLLQSLRSLCAAAETSGPGQSDALMALMQRQLPQITQRLNTTLDKLKAPQEMQATLLDAGRWWERLLQRNAGRRVAFEMQGSALGQSVPADLFDSVVDNLIENSLGKDGSMSAANVRVTFSPLRGGTLTVCDNGSIVPEVIARQLFTAPVPSQTGLGIGLYHAAQQADRLGYRLTLAANQPGTVCFVLTAAA